MTDETEHPGCPHGGRGRHPPPDRRLHRGGGRGPLLRAPGELVRPPARVAAPVAGLRRHCGPRRRRGPHRSLLPRHGPRAHGAHPDRPRVGRGTHHAAPLPRTEPGRGGLLLPVGRPAGHPRRGPRHRGAVACEARAHPSGKRNDWVGSRPAPRRGAGPTVGTGGGTLPWPGRPPRRTRTGPCRSGPDRRSTRRKWRLRRTSRWRRRGAGRRTRGRTPRPGGGGGSPRTRRRTGPGT